MLDRNIKNLNKMLVKINDNMFGGSTKRPPPSPSMTAATSAVDDYLPSALLRPENTRNTNSQPQQLKSSGSSVTLPSPLRSASGSGLGPTALAGGTSSASFSSKSMSMSSFPATATISSATQQQQLQSAMSSATSSQTQATTVTTALLSGRTKLLRHRHQQQQQQQQFHHHHHHHHYTPQLRFRLLPGLKATSFFTILTLVCLETVLLSTVSNCAKTFYMHWNTSNSIFRIDNTDHIIDVNKGNLAFEFDQVHIICPVYEPGTFENETEKYIIYNVSKVEYETCRITNADPRVIAICDKPQKLMFFTITFRPFTPQPGGLEFLPGNDYYFISTSSKGDLYRRIGGRCSTNNMKVVFKVCCAPEDKNNRTNNNINGSGIGNGGNSGGGGGNSGGGGGGGGGNSNTAIQQQQHNNNININGGNIGGGTGLLPSPKMPGMGGGIGGGGGGGNGGGGMNGMNNGVIGGGGGLMINGNSGTSINTNIDQFNRIPMQQPNNIGGMGMSGMSGIGGGGIGGGNGGNNMGMNGGMGQHQTGIRINNVPSSQQHPSQKNGMHGGFISPMANINTNSSNVVQSTISWPDWGNHKNNNYNNHMGEHHGKNDDNDNDDDDDGSDDSDRDTDVQHSTPVSTIGIHPHFYPSYILTSPRPSSNLNNTRNLSPSHKPTKKTNDYDKHPNEVVKNEELTYNSAASSLSFFKMSRRRTSSSVQVLRALRSNNHSRSPSYKSIYQKFKSTLLELLLYTTSNHRSTCNPIADIINFIFNCNPIIITTTVLVALTNLFQYKIMTSWNEEAARSDTLQVNQHNTDGRITRCQSRVLGRTRSFVKSLSSFRRRQDEEKEGDLPPSSSGEQDASSAVEAALRDRSSAVDCIQDSSSSTTKNKFSNTITR